MDLYFNLFEKLSINEPKPRINLLIKKIFNKRFNKQILRLIELFIKFFIIFIKYFKSEV